MAKHRRNEEFPDRNRRLLSSFWNNYVGAAIDRSSLPTPNAKETLRIKFYKAVTALASASRWLLSFVRS